MSVRFRRHAGPLIVLCALAASPDARAEEEKNTAEELFRAGRKASDAGDHASACRLFQRSLALDESRGTRLNLALCRMKVGQLLQARADLRDVAQQLDEADPRRALVEKHLDDLEARIPRAQLVTTLPAGAELRCDGKPLPHEALALPLPVDPGRHEFVVLAPGAAPSAVSVTFYEGELRTVALAPGPALAPAPSEEASSLGASAVPASRAAAPPSVPPVAASSATNKQPTVVYVLLGLSGAGLVSAGVSVGLMLAEQGRVQTHCPDKSCDPEGLAAGARGRRLVVIAAASAGVAALSGGLGFYLARKGGSTRRQAQLQLAVDGSGASFSLAGRF